MIHPFIENIYFLHFLAQLNQLLSPIMMCKFEYKVEWFIYALFSKKKYVIANSATGTAPLFVHSWTYCSYQDYDEVN